MAKRLTLIVFASLATAVLVGATLLVPREPRVAEAPAPAFDPANAGPSAGPQSPPSAIPESARAVLRAMAAGVQSATVAPRTAGEEAALMAQLREMRQSDPELSLRLAREGNDRFPESADAAERASFVVKSLMRMGRADEATAEAKAMVDKYPGTPWAIDVKHHMLDIPSYVPDSPPR